MAAKLRLTLPSGQTLECDLQDATLLGAMFEIGASQVELNLDQGAGHPEHFSMPMRVLIELMIHRNIVKYPGGTDS